MNILALDTSTEACSVALLCNNTQIIARFECQPNQHSRLILPMIEAVLAEAGLHRTMLDAIAFGRGPGSFTGLRIAASVTQGIAFAHDLPVIPISSLHAMAQAAYEAFGYTYILAAIDAHVQSLYYGVFALEILDDHACVQPICPEVLLLPKDWQLPEIPTQYLAQYIGLVGSGWRYFDVSAKIDYYPKASAMLSLAKKAFNAGMLVAPEQALPVYLHELQYKKKES